MRFCPFVILCIPCLAQGSDGFSESGMSLRTIMCSGLIAGRH